MLVETKGVNGFSPSTPNYIETEYVPFSMICRGERTKKEPLAGSSFSEKVYASVGAAVFFFVPPFSVFNARAETLMVWGLPSITT